MRDLYHIADSLGNLLRERNLMLCTAESCTGGGVAYALTNIPGSSQWFRCGWVTYCNLSKHELIDVPEKLLKDYGAVSEEVAKAMASGALAKAKAEVAIAITGIAGPGGGTPDKPVGTVWFAWAGKTNSGHVTVNSGLLSLSGDRADIRQEAVIHAIRECEHFVKSIYP
jgi:nicotinamide-nucleotide amidase